jgi:hypothetical protein
MKIKLLKPTELGIPGHVCETGSFAEVDADFGKKLIAEGSAKEVEGYNVATTDVEADVHSADADLRGAERADALPRAKRPV